MDIKQVTNQALGIIAKNKGSFKGASMIMAPIFTDENIGEGYIQRVKTIDDVVLNETLNIYVDLETKNEQPTLTQVDERHVLLTYNKNCKKSIKSIIKIARKCNLLYTHSVMRAMEDMVGKDIKLLYTKKDIFKIWDVHGSVPEEFALADNYFEAQNASQAEELFIQNSNVCVTVTTAMKNHLEKRYDKPLDTCVVLPILHNKKVDGEGLIAKKALLPPTVTYAGGLQAWQNIPLMQTVMKTKPNYNYNIMVSDPVGFKEIWGGSTYPTNCTIGKKTPEQVLTEYGKCHYGFVLRDDIVVNNVACPTKLIEYLQYAIVPIIKTEHIGDFAMLGMRYITDKDFTEHTYSMEQYAQMANENLTVIDKIISMQQDGLQQLRGLVYEKLDI